MNNRPLPCAVLVTLLLVTAPLSAHHGAAAYDIGHPAELAATVTAFEWRNPHALLRFDVRENEGAVEHWVAETAGLVILVRAGWDRHALKPGDRVTVVGFRATNGTNTMLLRRVVLDDGHELTNFIPTQ